MVVEPLVSGSHGLGGRACGHLQLWVELPSRSGGPSRVRLRARGGSPISVIRDRVLELADRLLIDAECRRTDELALTHRDAACDLGEVFAEGGCEDQLLELTEGKTT